ncbi:MAG: ComEC/Rec2 family competence protein [Thermoleophilia bacterium]|nr:ComEC/Rec2 family competence protein [Thermoleophilia bacterium]
MRIPSSTDGRSRRILRLAPHGILLACCAGLALAAVRSAPGWLVLVTPVAGLAAVARPGPVALAGLAGVVLAGGWLWGTGRMHQTAPREVAARGTLEAVAVVDAVPRRRPTGGWRVTVRLTAVRRAVDPGLAGTRIIVWVRGSAPRTGDLVLVRGTLRPSAREGSPGWWLRYLDRQGVSASVATGRLPVVGHRGGFAGLRDRTAQTLRGRIGERLDGSRGALVEGMALGGSEGLDTRTEEQVRDAGLAHLLAVSGQNVAVVGLAITSVLSALRVSRRTALPGVAMLVVAYCLVCEPGASVARAGVVAVAALLAEGLSRDRDRWYLLLLALAGLLAWQPRSVWDPGLQLSFAAVAGILALGGPLRSWWSRWLPRWAAELAAVALAAGLATAPVLVADFGRVSVAGLVTNLVAVPLASAVLLTALAGAVAAPVLGPLAPPLIHVAGLGAGAILEIAAVSAGVPGATVALPAWTAPLAALPAIAVLALSGGRARRLVHRVRGTGR